MKIRGESGRKSVKCKVDRTAVEEREEEEEAGEKIRGKRRKKAARSGRGRTRERRRQDGDGVGPSRCIEWKMGSSGRMEEEAAREQR